jgi:hypothetical protein
MYDFGDKKYCNKKRWGTYYEQLKRAIDREYKSYLIIGPGDNIVPIVLKRICPNAVVETYDIKDVTATYIGDVCDFDSVVGDKTWECVICCQVLEHVEFSNFVHILDMISSHTNKKMIISLPKKINKIMTIYHKWEIGSIEDIKTSSDIKNILSKYGDVTVENITDRIYIFDIIKE